MIGVKVGLNSDCSIDFCVVRLSTGSENHLPTHQNTCYITVF